MVVYHRYILFVVDSPSYFHRDSTSCTNEHAFSAELEARARMLSTGTLWPRVVGNAVIILVLSPFRSPASSQADRPIIEIQRCEFTIPTLTVSAISKNGRRCFFKGLTLTCSSRLSFWQIAGTKSASEQFAIGKQFCSPLSIV